ncbi:hypothetical protein [Actinoplanes sp. TFC3]|uniref:hypothetical protein n=1 Tax=Actinoplanes sp. TFC3 TaxID=1710355 RepID=UPI000835B4B0|nr:hypothetical protein [Actinoplanes sp. TFC3]
MSARKLLATTLGTVAGAALLAAPAAAAPSTSGAQASADCTTYQNVTTKGLVKAGYESVPWAYFWNEGDEMFSFCVDVPDGTEVVAEVRKMNQTGQWDTVFTAPAGPGDKVFTYHVVNPALYRLYITSASDIATYTTGLSFSRIN